MGAMLQKIYIFAEKYIKMKVGIIQQACSTDVKANIQKLCDSIRKAAHQGAELVVLQ